MVGGAGDDVVDGGAGTDTLLYGSSFASFGFSFTSPVDLIISSVAGVDWGTDTVFGFEWFQFTDVLRDFTSLFNEFGGGVPNQPPTATNDGGIGYTTDEDTAFATASVPATGCARVGGTLSVLSFDTSGTLGLVTDNGDGTFGYDPNGQFEGLAAGASATDSFSYTLSDGQGGTDTATVTVTIQGRDEPNLPPTALNDGGVGFTTDE
ncbi:MAG: hypothetical protein GY778_29205, partial [bacterium]|nr:hypothetical protein [bacterium]